MELKVECDCGQRFKFDVDPVKGRMPFAVNCPVCGSDGTAKANEILNQRLGAAAATTPGRAPVGVLIGATPPEPPAALPMPAVRMTNRLEPAPPPAHTVMVSPGPPAPPAPVAAPVRRHLPGAAPAVQTAPGKKPSFGLGLLGALTGTLIGSGIYFLVFNYTGFRFKLLAVGVGYLAGFGAEWLGRKEGSKELGMIAGALTLAGVIGAQYAVAWGWWHGGLSSRVSKSFYESTVAEAKKVVKAVPNGSDEEIRLYLAKQESDPGEKPDLKAVTEEDIKEFREKTLPSMRDLASGKTTKEQFEKDAGLTAAKESVDKLTEDAGEGTFKAIFLLLLLSKFNLFSLAAGAGLAFKVCSNA